MIVLLLLACDGALPPTPEQPAVPVSSDATGPLLLRLGDGQVFVGDTVVNGLPGPDPAGIIDKVATAVRLVGAKSVLIDAPAAARWLHVRQVAVSAREGGATHLAWRLGDLTVGPSDLTQHSTGRIAGVCSGERLTVSHVDRRYTVNVEADSEASWVRASVRFRPSVIRGDHSVALEGLEPACWAATSCDGLLIEGPARAACQAAQTKRVEPAPRVPIGAGSGCIAPLWKGNRPHGWEIGDTLAELGASGHDVQLIPEARARWDVVHATLASLDERLGLPHLPLSLLQGNDGPPACDAPARTLADVEQAAGTWVGAQLAAGADL